MAESSPWTLLFQPSQTALFSCMVFCQRSGSISSFQVLRLSPWSVTPGTVPWATSMSSWNVARGRNALVSKRVMYMVLGSQWPMTRWSRKMGR